MSVSLVKKSLDLVGIEDQTPTKVELIKRRSDKKRPFDGRSSATAVVKKIRENSNQTEENKIETNVQKLLNLSQTETIHKKLEKKLLTKVLGREQECAVKDQRSVFTDEDFSTFEREYFVNGWY